MTIKTQKAAEFLTADKQFISSIKPKVLSALRPIAFASRHTDAKIFSQGSYIKSFVMPDLFLEQAEDMGKFLDKNPLPERD